FTYVALRCGFECIIERDFIAWLYDPPTAVIEQINRSACGTSADHWHTRRHAFHYDEAPAIIARRRTQNITFTVGAGKILGLQKSHNRNAHPISSFQLQRLRFEWSSSDDR